MRRTWSISRSFRAAADIGQSNTQLPILTNQSGSENVAYRKAAMTHGGLNRNGVAELVLVGWHLVGTQWPQ